MTYGCPAAHIELFRIYFKFIKAVVHVLSRPHNGRLNLWTEFLPIVFISNSQTVTNEPRNQSDLSPKTRSHCGATSSC